MKDVVEVFILAVLGIALALLFLWTLELLGEVFWILEVLL